MSRIFRAVVRQEIVAIVDEDGVVDLVVNDGLIQCQTVPAGHVSRLDFAAVVRDAVMAEDCGPAIYVTPGESSVSEVEELTA